MQQEATGCSVTGSASMSARNPPTGRPLSSKQAHHSRMRDIGSDIHSEIRQVGGDLDRCPELSVAELRVLVWIATPLDDLDLHIGGPPVDLFSKRTAQVLAAEAAAGNATPRPKNRLKTLPCPPGRFGNE